MDTLTDDIVVALATFVPPRDLVSLGRTCKRLGGRPGWFARKKRAKKRRGINDVWLRPSKRRKPGTAQKLEAERLKAEKAERAKAIEVEGREWSLAEEAAKRIVDAAKDEDEGWCETFLSRKITKRESWIKVYSRLLEFRASLVFSSFIGETTEYVKKGDFSAVQNRSTYHEPSLAFCNEIMKTGKHYVQFRATRMHPSPFVLPIGLMRPIHRGAKSRTKKQVKLAPSDEPFHTSDHMNISYEVPTPWGYERYCSDNAETPGFEGGSHCFFLPVVRHENEWYVPVPGPPGSDDAFFISLSDDEWLDTVLGFLLDLDDGALTLYQDGREIGVVKRGLGGHYRWTAFVSPRYDFCDRVKVERAPVPAD